ncbi:nuclear transport factor 2 family protein [Tenacibaculum maritimum]|uniref:nuclear transport factor 2 family protein n=1 Tax=Tenacibaculum maritimum TaxID=107401 RepID=UPI0012E61DDD|nr:nuclear transport factor 2 family protein [Tenacibaculum maritimum]CAA0143674.1 Ketosteroid isomerase-related protein [Tenacibaculum maritimum]CAA0144372.1 Ketosteroid isomerase-related protein [Tenacibaculum maritimum]CAA0206841.1 Ketosteroid isomerase-related protein [Tenacibaculum maritimum]CAA0248369.1 Ketosteroid isomerase-related protein [Tenacibaculum maritimum]CAA0253823.1 Ketosteroid isomerase-related protein [Tenacibaculum maritimum]
MNDSIKNKELIQKFYTSFSNGNIKDMTDCYHKDITFQDPVFGKLKGQRAIKMWEMLLSQKKDSTKVTFSDIKVDTKNGKANWVAEYLYSETNRKVVNKVSAAFTFKEGKIATHTDSFDLWKWTKQAMGPVGYLIGWTPFMKNKIQKAANHNLDTFIKSN